MKLRQLEALRLVLARGTTKHAAESLGLTQSAVSRLVTQLEKELGFLIFDRRHGRLFITPEGQHFYTAVEKVLAGVDQINAMARDITTLGTGTLRILAMPALGYGMLPKAIAIIRAKYERVKISVDLGVRPDVERGIARGDYDFGVATLPIEHESIVVEPLCGVDAVCVLPPDHRLAEKLVIDAQDLQGEQFISIEPGTLFRYRTDELFSRLGIQRDLRVEAQSTVMVCNLVAMGIGVSLVHRFIAETFGGRIVARPFAPAVRFEYGLLFPAGQPLSKVAQEFIATLRETVTEFENEPGEGAD